MPQSDIDDLYEQIKGTGVPGGVLISGTVTERTLHGTARIIPPTLTQAELVRSPTDGTDGLPITARDARKMRSPKEFVDAARRYMDPDATGKLFADTITAAFQEKDAVMLKILLPYLFGAHPKEEQFGAGEGAMESLLHILTDSKPKIPARPRSSRVIDGLLQAYDEPDVPESQGDDDADQEQA